MTKDSTSVELSRDLAKRVRAFLLEDDNKIKYRTLKGFVEHAIIEKFEREKAINKSK